MITFTTKVEVAFNAGYSTSAASRTWTDVTAYVLTVDGIDIDYGRQDERGQADANRLRLTLKNNDGRFTPGLSSSPYYPNVKVGRPIRVTRTPSGGAASTRFVGYVDEWPLSWPAVVPTLATVSITGTSRSARLARSALKSIVADEILADGPAAYYTLGEAEGATSAADTSGNGVQDLVPFGIGAPVVFGTATGPGTDSLTAAEFAGGRSLAAPAAVSAATTLWVEAFFNTSTAPPASGATIASLTGANSTIHASLSVDSLDRLAATGPGSDMGSGVVVNDGLTHHAAVKWTDTGANVDGELYLDGVLVDTGTNPDANPLTFNRLIVGAGVVEGDITAQFTGAISHVAYGTTDPDAARFADVAEAGSTGFAGDTPAARIERYASYVSIPAAELDLDTGQAPITHIDTTGRSPIEVMRLVADTDGGVLFDDRDGDLRYDGRDVRYNASTALTLSVAAGELGLGYEPKLDLSALVNEVNAASTDGTVVVRAVDEASQDDYGIADVPLQMATVDPNEIHAAAWWRLNTLNEPAPRVATLSVELATLSSSTKAAAVLACNVGSLIQVTGLPANAPSTSAEYFVEGYTESIGATTHSITFNVSPADGYDVWTVGDAVFGQYDAYPLAY